MCDVSNSSRITPMLYTSVKGVDSPVARNVGSR